jgi:hypothetical protein
VSRVVSAVSHAYIHFAYSLESIIYKFSKVMDVSS